MGKKTGGDSATQDGGSGGDSGYTPMPISSLRDPASFAPPPKRTGTAGRAPPGTDPAGGSAYASPAAQQPEPQPEEERPEPQPYRRDTTGLSTSHLPPPPGRRDGANGKPPAPAVAGRPPAMKPKPSLPPRLPPRQTEHVDEYTPAAPPPYSVEAQPPAHQGILNQGAMNRLGAAGVSVPGFGIAPSPSPPLPSRRQAGAPPPPVSPQKPAPSQLGELQSRFAKFTTSSSQNETPQPADATQGTTWAQKQAALKTASSFRNGPSSVSFSDARAAASTANNFRERHGAQVASGLQSANNLNNKYGVTDKAGAVAAYGVGNTAPAQSPIPARDQINGMNLDGHAHSVAAKKAPPPPPKKRPDLVGTQQSSGPPPPIPMSSKPKPPVSSYKY